MEQEEKNQQIESSETIDEDWEKVEPKFWKAEKEGDTISGIYIGKREDVGEFGSEVYDIQTKGELLTVFGSTVLKDRMRYVQIGQQIKIIFKGKKKGEGKGKKPYNIFEVFSKPVQEMDKGQVE